MRLLTKAEEDYLKVRNELAFKILAQDMSSRFCGKFEVWIEDGYCHDIKNTQNFGVSAIGGDLTLLKLE